jgi:hypothetical protein
VGAAEQITTEVVDKGGMEEIRDAVIVPRNGKTYHLRSAQEFIAQEKINSSIILAEAEAVEPVVDVIKEDAAAAGVDTRMSMTIALLQLVVAYNEVLPRSPPMMVVMTLMQIIEMMISLK